MTVHAFSKINFYYVKFSDFQNCLLVSTGIAFNSIEAATLELRTSALIKKKRIN